jgi:hypothetical protein
VARNLGTPGGQVPPAVRTSSPGWRDPRLWVGVAIVAASVLVGTRVLAAADDTVQVWAVSSDVAPGETVSEGDLEAHRLRFADGGDLERYFEVGEELPDDLTLSRALGSGDLLPRSAIGDGERADTVTVSLAVSPLRVPSGVHAGAVVDVYVTGDASPDASPDAGPDASSGAAAPEPGVPVLEDVRVVAAPSGDDVSPGSDRKVELAVPDAEVAGLYALLGSLTTPVVSVAQVS